MFLCHHAKETVLGGNTDLKARWKDLRSREKEFTWPDGPVLFDDLEEIFVLAGLESPLMYFHRSPGQRPLKRGTALSLQR